MKDSADERCPSFAAYNAPMRETTRRLHRYTYADYVALEMVSAEKHELLDGEIYAMAGGSEEHSALAAAMLSALHIAVGARPCRAHTSDLRIYRNSAVE